MNGSARHSRKIKKRHAKKITAKTVQLSITKVENSEQTTWNFYNKKLRLNSFQVAKERRRTGAPEAA